MSNHSPATRTVKVAFGDGRGYDVVIGYGVLSGVADRVRQLFGAKPWFVVVDDGVPAEYQVALTHDSSARVVRWKSSEADKSLVIVERLLHQMAADRFERGSPVVTLGGGITGDVAGFAAAIYQRGTPWINCPTTLLSMVDASVGGKTGVNIRVGDAASLKNMVGAFHQPSLVVADVETLDPLDPRVFRAGLAECIKHALIGADWGDPSLLDWFKANHKAILDQNPAVLVELIARNIAIKAKVVAADERESGHGKGGGRMALNLGHTFAHAIETLPGLATDGRTDNAPLHHGEAVGLGLIAAAGTSQSMGICTPDLFEEVRAVVVGCQLPSGVAGLPDDAELIRRMLHDKKVRDAKLRLILPTERGRVAVFDDPPEAAVRAGLNAIRAY